MKVTFVSNYINHHQIPFCEAMAARLKDDFAFVQTMPMEEERTRMGWGVDERTLPYVKLLYEDEAACRALIMDSDAVIFGWTERFDIEAERMDKGLLTFRLSERIYREGQWKMVSPRGLFHKYREHYRYRNAPVYLLCAGAYVASDFALLRCYKNRMYRFGYFPPLYTYTREDIARNKNTSDGTLRLMFAGRMLDLKRPDYCVRLAAKLKGDGEKFHLDMVGDGPDLEQTKQLAKSLDVADVITFHGMLPPGDVRRMMERAHLFLFPSNYLEGWGAVVNEAMNAACLVVASAQAGCAPYLLKEGDNGLLFSKGSFTDFAEQVKYGMVHETKRMQMGEAAYYTIAEHWNADRAADALLQVTEQLLKGEEATPSAGRDPMCAAPIIRPDTGNKE